MHTFSQPSPRRVVIVGGSVAGLFAAAAVADPGRTVTVLERDPLPDVPLARRGVPQGDQPHVYLYRGLLAVEELLPGLRAELLAHGAVPFDTGDLPWLAEPGWLRTGERAYEVVSLTRPLFELLVRRRVALLAGVEIRPDSRVVGIGSAAGGAWTVRQASGASIAADLVIDASGRSSRLPEWLAQLGISPAPVTEVDATVGYATRVYARSASDGLPGVVLQQTPADLTGGVAFAVEGDRWQVAAIGCAGRRPPREPDAYVSFLHGLRDPALAELAASAQPLTAIALHRQTGNRRYHYDRVPNWPRGLLVVGDALCAFNPIYGQGVSVAACEALLIRQELGRRRRRGYEGRLLRRFRRVLALPWAIAAGDDLRYPTSEGSQSTPQRILGRWTRTLARLAATGDREAQASLSRVYHLMGSPALLFRPRLLLAAGRAVCGGFGAPVPRPEVLEVLSRSATLHGDPVTCDAAMDTCSSGSAAPVQRS